ncbi:Stk1 family PASTA domain-containing Ser/Thr kinase [Streptomyces hainanensis]|uniref:non-specific serine/threonine protein kinase n=1 Tax=Streptomyces hainanensis TaxID=402648 RepID=A0A4R4U1M9_9ACTN|nr:Stk1 family PASTA domain-containing Ser/Thr kinase [Streptomyces hainanensis]TDC80409.1 Stk1 family PASTA domain-containing Ser/Thr kinase [Streptomyces hainanensis]
MDAPPRFADRYELRQVLGRGGMAEVYLAHDSRLGRTVAVKTLLGDLARDPVFQARFRREAQSAGSLNHPAITAIYDTGEDQVNGVPMPYIVMEYVEGSTLRDLLHTGRGLLPERVMEICVGVLQALDYSHGAGIVHRDIKPANVMLTPAGQVKVMDFGIARASGDSGMTMTQTAAVIGTAHYMSPEQARGEKVDARSDLYSTGCMLYELLTGRPPFVGDSPVAVAYQHVSEEPTPPSVLAEGISPGVDAVVLRSLAKDREWRYQSAAEMRADLEAVLEGRGMAVFAPPPEPSASRASGAATASMPAMSAARTGVAPAVPDGGGRRANRRPPQRRSSQRSTVLLAVGAVLVLIGAVAIGRLLFPDEGDGGGGTTLTVPDLTGLSFEDARARAANQSLVVAEGTSRPCVEEADTVCETSPAADEEIERGETVTLIMSSGPEPVEVPNVVGDPFQEALAELQDSGFRVAQESQEDGSAEPGTVLTQDPEAGEEAEPGETVTLVVADAPESDSDEEPDPGDSENQSTVAVPSVVGQEFNAAAQALRNTGFEPVLSEEQNPSIAAGTVIRQSPEGGAQVAPGTPVEIVYAVGAGGQDQNPDQPDTPEETPNVLGQQFDQARQGLEAQGFSVSREDRADGRFQQGTVIEQRRSGDSMTLVVAVPG